VSGGKSSRAKGIRGESESARVFTRNGFRVVQYHAGRSTKDERKPDPADYIATLEGLAVLVQSRRRERLHIATASREVEKVAQNGQVPVVVYRANRQPWRVSLRLEDFARLLGTA
jgi:Holliday junction resolvase